MIPHFSSADHQTWKTVLDQHILVRGRQIHDLFLKGVEELKISADHIPDLKVVNETLQRKTGFRGEYVQGLEEGNAFFALLASSRFPVGNFIRSAEDLSYTPAPDVIHDLYGHLPFFTDKSYAEYCRKFGEAAAKYADIPALLRQFERFFWFTIEFGLVQTPSGVRVFGAGIASSTGECDYALSGRPEIAPFSVDAIRKQEFRIDIMQPKLFLLESPEQLYESLTDLERKIENDRN